MGDIDCGDCDCGDCDCGNCKCDCDDCCDDCCNDCCQCKDCDGCCSFFTAFSCASCCSDFLEMICCENTCDYGNRSNSYSTGHHHHQRRQQQQFQRPPHLEPRDNHLLENLGEDGLVEPAHPSAPPPSYDEVVLSQPMGNGHQPAITSQPGYGADIPSSNI